MGEGVDVCAWALIGKGIDGGDGERVGRRWGGGVVDLGVEAGVLGAFEEPFPCCEIGRDYILLDSGQAEGPCFLWE